jgi:hypothetical protein
VNAAMAAARLTRRLPGGVRVGYLSVMRRELSLGLAIAAAGVLWALGCGSAAPAAQAPLVAPSVPMASVAEPAADAPVPASASAAAPSAPAVRAPGELPGYRIDPAALVGCRAPDEPGCASCCSTHDSGCERLWSPEDWSQPGMGEAWYNAASAGCPRECAACASCNERQERELAAMLPFKCDCENFQPTIDPCFQRGSCACECSRRQHLTKACPKAP